jgi:hypothetical protein
MYVQIGQAAEKGLDWWTLAGPSSTLLAAIVGWLIVERFARRRERRTDLRTLIQVLDDSIDRIVNLAADFYALDGKDKQAPIIANSIKAKIATLATHLNTIRKGGVELNTDLEMRTFRQAVTGGAFESAERPPISSDSITMATIRMAGEDLSLKVKAEFFRSITGNM